METVSWGTRKALGRRYAVDPALLLESQRLEEQYNLAPGREARALQESQFNRSLALQEEAIEGQETGAMLGTAANLATSIPMTYFMGKSAGLWGAEKIVEGEYNLYNALYGPGAALATGAGAGGAGATLTGMGVASGSTIAPMTTAGVTPALTDIGMMGAEAATTSGAAAPTGMMGAAAPYVLPAAAGYVGGKLGQPIGEFLGVGGKNERGAVGGAMAGAAIGSMILPGPGTLIGGAIGGVIGILTSGGSNILTGKHGLTRGFGLW